jgi:uncharacterized membrane protein
VNKKPSEPPSGVGTEVGEGIVVGAADGLLVGATDGWLIVVRGSGVLVDAIGVAVGAVQAANSKIKPTARRVSRRGQKDGKVGNWELLLGTILLFII